jgi:hypothetical protein
MSLATFEADFKKTFIGKVLTSNSALGPLGDIIDAATGGQASKTAESLPFVGGVVKASNALNALSSTKKKVKSGKKKTNKKAVKSRVRRTSKKRARTSLKKKRKSKSKSKKK